MAYQSNRPDLARLKRQLTGVDLTGTADQTLQELLDASIGWVEDKASTFFNGRAVNEVRDGNGTNAISLFLTPATSVQLVKVELPVLALTRTYLPNEIKLYRRQGRLSIFTYKLAAEHASLHLDQQVYGNIFPTLPQCVFIDYTAGFPQYDATADRTTLDGGATFVAGDQREPREQNMLGELQQAALCDAAASYLAQVAGLSVGTVMSVSFDGFSKSMNPQAYGAQVQALVERRDELMNRRSRRFMLATVR